MKEDESGLIEIVDDTPRSVSTRIAMLTMNSMGKMSSMLPAAMAGRSDEWVRETTKLVVEFHDRLKERLDQAMIADHHDWEESVGETFEMSVQKNRVRGAGRPIVPRRTDV